MTLRWSGFLCAVVLSWAQVLPQQPGAGPAQPTEQCRIEGRVTSLASGQALRKATLRLQTLGQGASISIYNSTTDGEGTFVFEDVEPGRYVLSAERPGFVQQMYGARSPSSSGTPLTLKPGQQMNELVFKLVAQGLIEGRVGDEDGDPLSSALLEVYRYGYSGGRRMLRQINNANVNADGTFMIGNLTAGRYFLSASTGHRMWGVSLRERPGRRTPEEEYATTYYPNALEPSNAAPIDVSAGSEIRGIEIRLRKTRLFRVRGKLLGTGTGQNIVLNLIPDHTPGRAEFFRPPMSAARDSNGDFEFNYVMPGTYLMSSNPNLRINGEGVSPLVVRYQVTVSDHNIDDLAVPLIASPEVNGAFRVEGADAPVIFPGRARPGIMLDPIDGPGVSAPQSAAKEDGTFQLTGVAPDRYRVAAHGVDGMYVKSVRFGGQEVSKTGIDLTSGSGGKLEILLSPHPADVSGIVRDADGSAVGGVLVLLWTAGLDPPKTATTDQNGAFKIRDLAPGEYRVAAWEELEPGLAEDPDFRGHFESQATSLTLREDSHENAEVKLIPKDAMPAPWN